MRINLLLDYLFIAHAIFLVKSNANSQDDVSHLKWPYSLARQSLIDTRMIDEILSNLEMITFCLTKVLSVEHKQCIQSYISGTDDGCAHCSLARACKKPNFQVPSS